MIHSIFITAQSSNEHIRLQDVFRRAGCRITRIFKDSQTQEALTLLRSGQVELVILDGDGFEFQGLAFLETLAVDPALKQIPALTVGSGGDREQIQRFIAAGAGGYMKKPFTPEQITHLLPALMDDPS